MFCTNCGQKLKDGDKFCFKCGKVVEVSETTQEQEQELKEPTENNFTAPKPFQPYSSIDPNQGMINKTVFKGKQISIGSSGSINWGGNKPKQRGKLRIVLAFFVFAVLILFTITMCTYFLSHPKLNLGKTTEETKVSIPTSGGTISVNDTKSSIDGFKIIINPDTYDKNVDFKISTTEITGHNYGKEFSPITPLITVDNAHDFADRPMQVTVPISITENEFAMGFYYNRSTGVLEAIPFIDVSTKQIVLLTNHFSDIVISKISISELEKLTSENKTNADSGFLPGRDDWQFINYGSALAPQGHCAGQSLTMSWYYQNRHIAKSEPRLYGRFDNNGGPKTENFWIDDSNAYRFASVVQYNIDWESQEFHNYLNFSSANQIKVFYAFAYAIMITDNPQFMGIYHYDSNGNKAGGHAIVAYKVEGNKIFVADPNYPGQKDRYCELGNNGFKPYSSGANAADINANGAVLYTEMHFIAASALIDFDLISDNYEKMLDGSVGDKEFPASLVETMTKYSNDISAMSWSKDTNITLGKDYYNSLPSEMKSSTIIKITPQADNLVYSLYMNDSIKPVEEPVIEVFEGSIYFEINLSKGDNTVAFLVEKVIGNNYSYVDFIEITIKFSPNDNPVESKVTSISNNSNKLIDKLPGEYKLTHIGGVGAPGSENTSIVSETYFIYADGTYTFRGVRKDTDPITFEGTWTLKGSELKFNDGPPYTFTGETFTLDGSYPWVYTAVRKYD